MLSTLKKLLGFAPSAQDLFADAMKSVLLAEGVTSFVYDRAKFAFVDGSKTIHLHSIFGRCREMAPKDQARLLVRFVRGVLVPPREITGVRDLADDVVPVIRSRAEIALHTLMAQAVGDGPWDAFDLPHEPFAGDLVVTLGIDQADAIQRVSPSDLERLGMTVADLLPRAKANLRRLHPRTGFAPAGTMGLFHATEAETYQASMLLYPPGQALQFPAVEGTPLLMVPTRDMMFLVGSDNTRGLEALLDLVFDTYVDWQHRCGTALWTWREGQWEAWQPPAGSTAYRKWSNCQVIGRATDYVMQKGALEALHRRRGLDIHVARFKMALKDEAVHATCAWTEGVNDALLPRTDTITFVPRAGPPFVVPWGAVERVAGHLLEPVSELYPERVRVRTFPTDEQRAALEVIQVA